MSIGSESTSRSSGPGGDSVSPPWPVHLHGLVLVKWLDAAGDREQSAANPIPCLSVGWIVELAEMNGHRYLKLATELMVGDGRYETQEHVSIPEGMVEKVIPVAVKLPAPFDRWPARPIPHERKGDK